MKNTTIIDQSIDGAMIALCGRGGHLYGYARVDIDDLPLIGHIKWTRSVQGYAVGRDPKTKRVVKMNRFLFFGSDYAEDVIDHVSRNRLDNRRSNLRLTDQASNSRNTTLAKNNSSGAKGVSKTKTGKWRARIWKDWREIHIGTFDTIEAASAAYDKAAAELHGEFASPNNLGAI